VKIEIRRREEREKVTKGERREEEREKERN
jgi:hypothetical protein